MEPVIDRELSPVQAGFRKKRGTRDQIANIWWTWERAREYNQIIFLCFIDYKEAFDCVDHTLLWTTLKEMGFANHLTALLHNFYKEQTVTVRTECGDTHEFAIGKGVRQWCILSPTLFNLYAEKIMREASMEESEDGVRIGGKIINNLRYADDTTLAAESEGGLEILIEKVSLQKLAESTAST